MRFVSLCNFCVQCLLKCLLKCRHAISRYCILIHSTPLLWGWEMPPVRKAQDAGERLALALAQMAKTRQTQAKDIFSNSKILRRKLFFLTGNPASALAPQGSSRHMGLSLGSIKPSPTRSTKFAA